MGSSWLHINTASVAQSYKHPQIHGKSHGFLGKSNGYHRNPMVSYNPGYDLALACRASRGRRASLGELEGEGSGSPMEGRRLGSSSTSLALLGRNRRTAIWFLNQLI